MYSNFYVFNVLSVNEWEASSEIAAASSAESLIACSPIVNVNAGGARFQTTLATLTTGL